MTPHLEAKKGDYSDIVLLPGDPLRAKWIAETYLDDVRQVNGVRNMLGFTGYLNWNDSKRLVSVQGGGMGMASNAIYIHELYNFYDVQTIIRVGSCGGIREDINVGDIVVASSAHTDNAMTSKFFNGTFCPSATEYLLRRYMELYSSIAYAGPIISSDWFYNPNENWWKEQQKLGTLAVEMETHILYALAHKFNKDALSICTVADHLSKPEINMSSKERETGFDRMIKSIFNSLLC